MLKARQTRTVCGLTRRGNRHGYQVRAPIEVLAHPDLATLAARVEELEGALDSIIKGNPRCSTSQAVLAWARDVARAALVEPMTVSQAKEITKTLAEEAKR